MEKIKALLWLRFNQIFKNKTLMTNILMPYVTGLIYLLFLENANKFRMLVIILNYAFVMSVGDVGAILISEEKANNNMRTLFLSGVNTFEYIFSIFFYPILIALITTITLPIVLGIDISTFAVEYFILSLVSCISIVLVFYLIAVNTKNQTNCQIYRMIACLMIMLIPLTSALDARINYVLQYTFMNSFFEFMMQASKYSLLNQSFMVSVFWLLLLVAMVIINNKLGKKIKI